MVDYVWLVPALPAAAFVVIGLFTRGSRRLSGLISVAAIGLAAVIAVLVFWEVYTTHRGASVNLPWVNLGPLGQLPFGWQVDPLTAVMLVVVAPIGFLIQVFSTGYLRGDPDRAKRAFAAHHAEPQHGEPHGPDRGARAAAQHESLGEIHEASLEEEHHGRPAVPVNPRAGTEYDLMESGPDRGMDAGYGRFFAYMSLFTMAMLGLVLANNLLTLYIFWEGVGLGSFLLIGYWYGKDSAALAAKKAFVTTRLGDFGMLVGILVVWRATGTFDFATIAQRIQSNQFGGIELTLAAILIFAGAVGKSAQFPLHVWLPDAMEGPTPVSALIHAATMVAAGVYLVARTFFMFEHSAQAMLVVAIIGGFTALFAATMGLVNSDIKRVMAFSTVSQLGYMMLALGSGSLAAGIFHLFNHAFFKALLFLTAGSVIHATHHEQDIFRLRERGRLKDRMPVTFWTMLIGALSLAGLPPFSGFWSKDEVLAATWDHGHGNMVLFAFAALTVFLTAFYMFRVIFVAFFGPAEPRHGTHGEDHAPVQESAASMTVPLMLLAIPSVVIGLWGSPFLGSGFQSFLEGHAVEHELDTFVAGLSVVLALAGIGLAAAMYLVRAISAASVTSAFRPIYSLLLHRYWMDELYNWLMRVLVIAPAGFVAYVFDQVVIDGVVNGVGRAAVALGAGVRGIQTGRVQHYGYVLFFGLFVIAVSFLWRFIFPGRA